MTQRAVLAPLRNLPPKTSIGEVKAALETHSGILAFAARELGISRTALADRVSRHTELQEHIRSIEERILDAAESVVYRAILNNDIKTARWALERKGRLRGWSAKVEMTGPDGAPIQVQQQICVTVEYVEAKAIEGDEVL